MRRTITAVAVLTALATAGGSACAGGSMRGHFDRSWQDFAPASTVLHRGSPAEAGLAPGPLLRAERQLAAWTNPTPDRPRPMYGGAVSLLAHDGTIVEHQATGHELRYADDRGTELPPERQEAMRPDTIFDLASLTKLFTGVATTQLADRGRIRLDAPVAEYLPEFAANGKQGITVEQLLTHTSGLQPEVSLWKLPPDQRIPSVMNLAPQHPPGSGYEYSDPNFIALGVLVSRVSGKPLDQVVHERIAAPLGMRDTGYNPPPSKLHRIAATEFQTTPPRGMIRGQVQDENAWSLGGVAGEAGMFSTAHDLAVLGQALLNGGTYRGHRILSPERTRQLLSNHNQRFPGNAHGLGFELDQRWYMAGLSSPATAGHTGFSGTSLVLDPKSRSIAVLLTNRVHPTRTWGSNNPSRQVLAQAMAQALAVEPPRGRREWFTGSGIEPRQATLATRELGPVAGPTEVSFDAFVDTQQQAEGVDPLELQSSVDGGRSWQPVPMTAEGPGAPRGPQQFLAGGGHRAWWRVTASVPARTGQMVSLRWSYSPDRQYVGRGVDLAGISVRDEVRELLDGPHQQDAFHPRGWDSTWR